MKKIDAYINKETLLFIIEGKKVKKEYILKNCRCHPKKLEQWLDVSSDVVPTISQAKKLAMCLHIPFAALYMDKKDIKLKSIPRIPNMRTVQDAETIDNSLLNIVIMDILIERDFLIETRQELEITSETFCANMISSDNPKDWADEIRRYFELDLEEQYKFTNKRQFYLYLRNKIEKKGIFIYCFRGFEIETIRGLAIYDSVMPMIGINSKDRHPAKSFSIIHELVHIYKRQSALCNEMYDNISSQQEEIFCNAVAGELLVPAEAIEIVLKEKDSNFVHEMSNIADLAKKFSVSREVIIRRLVDLGKINNDEYNLYNDTLKQELEKSRMRSSTKNSKKKSITRNMCKTIIDQTSSSICNILYTGYCEGFYDSIDISYYLGLNINYVENFFGEVTKWDS